VSDFTIAPPTCKWFLIGTGQAVTNYKEQHHPVQQKPKQQKGGGRGTPAPTKTNGKRQDTGKRVKTDEDLVKEKQGWLCLSVQSKKLPVFDKVTKGKHLCLGYSFLGRSCRDDNCNRTHANSIKCLSGEFKKKIIAWVKDPTKKVQWVPGKEPKNREQL
jgi:hypothetical protein